MYCSLRGDGATIVSSIQLGVLEGAAIADGSDLAAHAELPPAVLTLHHSFILESLIGVEIYLPMYESHSDGVSAGAEAQRCYLPHTYKQ